MTPERVNVSDGQRFWKANFEFTCVLLSCGKLACTNQILKAPLGAKNNEISLFCKTIEPHNAESALHGELVKAPVVADIWWG